MANEPDPLVSELVERHPTFPRSRIDFLVQESRLRTKKKRSKRTGSKFGTEPSHRYVAFLEGVKEDIEAELSNAKSGARESAQRKRERDRSYADALAEREIEERRAISKKMGEKALARRLRKGRMATDFPIVMDTRYPFRVPDTTFEKHEDAYSGPLDPELWGMRGESFKWHDSKAKKHAVSMAQLTEF